MRRLDRVSKNVLKNALKFTGRLRVVEAPPRRDECDVTYDDDCPPPVGRSYSPGVVIAYPLDQYGVGWGDDDDDHIISAVGIAGDGSGSYRRVGGNGRRRLAACFDPLDGSGNADASICTGTVFGIFDADAAGLGYDNNDRSSRMNGNGENGTADESSYLLSRSVLQPGSELLAAGYCLYSSTTTLVFTLGGGTHGFTLDTTSNEFVLTHPNMKIPKRGNIYSCNESYVDGWDFRFREYLSNIKNGRGETGRRYTQRYIGSMVGDVHRTLMYGGIFCCPADTNVHPDGSLQLVYKSAPMAYVLEHAGGKATDGKIDLLDVRPRDSVHVRSPCFMGSPDDMDELMTYLRRE
ncbi:hypothetical protein ACHAXA_008811 [Cyclostephanos tholiformis]|uniref:D-fructose-1,6-bisphosphate 1-phosphohydrolase n=1 Tax=Cyclostephanos tholiformis TaxID=382380 RepID=A0ABD3RTV2_9STRA